MDLDQASLLEFTRFVEQVEKLASQGHSFKREGKVSSTVAVLDGAVSDELRKTVEIQHRRKLGAFFTSTLLRRRLVSDIILKSRGKPIFDPTCGAGDLLLGVAETLPTRATLDETLKAWGGILYGVDIQPIFVRLTKARLLLLAKARGMWSDAVDSQDCFPNIVCGDSFLRPELPADCETVLLNPPYNLMVAPETYQVGVGKVSAAAVMVLSFIENLKHGAAFRAILPEVLRSGSRYERWREKVQKQVQIHQVSSVGRFDPYTDIDVFLLFGEKSESPSKFWRSKEAVDKLADCFTIRVGTVVPHRDSFEGPLQPYLTTKLISGQKIYDGDSAPRINHFGRAFRPPFIVVRRTSSPTDDPRVRATVITGEKDIFVENHLIVLLPNGSIDLSKVVDILQSHKTTQWMNEEMRCRHLTVRALADIPF